MRPYPRFWTPALVICLALSGCVEPAATAATGKRQAGDSVAAEVSRLQALGFRRASRPAEDGTIRLAYSGPINGAVLCAQRGGQPGRVQARTTLSDGRIQTISLDAYVTLSPGADGILAPAERDGLYAVSIVSKSPAAPTPTVQGITFAPASQASFQSGLTCRAA